MHRPALTEDEKELLQRHFQQSPIKLIRIKAQAILMVDKGLRQELIAELLGRSTRSLQRYVKDFSERRIASIFSGHVDNENASKLTRSQKKQIKEVLKKPPSDYNLPKEFWDVPQLKNYVKAEFGVVYESVQSYHFLLKYSDLSFKYPDKVSPKRDEKKIRKRLQEIQTEIKPLLTKRNWVVLTADETRIQLEAEIRRAWLRKGERTVVKTEKSRQHQNYLGFLDQKKGQCHVYETKRGNQEETIRVLEQLVLKYPDKRICIIWDNASWHKGKNLRKKLKKGQSLQRLHLISLPPYAPETNPIEHVWQYAKEKIANRQESNFKKTKSAFLSVINSRRFNYKI